MATARAAVVAKPGAIELRSFAIPDPEPGAVILKMRYSGICGTDKHTFLGESKQYAGTPHERDLTYPLICGHENVGIVVATGGEVRDSEGHVLRAGDRIVPGANVACGHCRFCLNSYPYYMCEHLEDYGNSLHCGRPPHLLGGWAEYLYLLPRSVLFRVPDNLPDHVAVLTEIMAVTHGVEKANALLGQFGGTPFGGSVAVLGVGPLGLCHLIKARLLGAGQIIATDRHQARLAMAREFGAGQTFKVGDTTMEERIAKAREATDGLGPDIVLDCSGVPESFVEAVRIVRVGGVVVEAGAFVDLGPVQINPNADICTKNVSIIGIGGETATSYLAGMRLMAANLDRLPFDRIVTHRMPLERAAEAMAIAQGGDAMKVVIAPNGVAL
ncbi:MAG TPA: zinc-binding dehydrogenase [Acidisoma sp.]|uniref:zinc-dependent alcohol dehydrogenase n=1 Tax=Acidisoma sp. TaxID=1872115 RepID=UPI002C809DA5|nr:zinc-binding dehydrogenase [Acidisoma sp.]HTH99600.1 zinc-binding dehydrogenase [Acidisoma sp.]